MTAAKQKELPENVIPLSKAINSLNEIRYSYKAKDENDQWREVGFLTKSGHQWEVTWQKNENKRLYNLQGIYGYPEYNLPIYLCQDPESAELLIKEGCIATAPAVPGGKWLVAYDNYLKNKHIIVVAETKSLELCKYQRSRAAMMSQARKFLSVRLVEVASLSEVTASAEAMSLFNKQLSKAPIFEIDHNIKKHGTTDIANAQRVAHYLGDSVLFTPSKDKKGIWFAWDGKRWAKDYQIVVGKYKEIILHKFPQEAAKCLDTDEADLLLQWIEKSSSAGSIRAALELAASEEKIKYPIDKFDKKTGYLNCLNGVLNLETGELEEWNPEHRSTKLANFNYRPELLNEAGEYRWDSFIKEVLPDEETREYLCFCIGKSFTGLFENGKFLFLKGGGRNGKGTLITTLDNIFGDYHEKANIGLFCTTQKKAEDPEKASPMLTSLVGARLVTAEEPERGSKWHEHTIKTLLSGNAKHKCRALHGDPIEADPYPVIMVSSNFYPTTRDLGESFFRRYVEIPFEQRFATPDPFLEETLLSELDYIGTTLVQYAMKYWRTRELPPLPAASEAANNKYRLNNDSFSSWLNETRERFSGTSEAAKDAYEDYKVYCQADSLDCERFTDFKDKLMENGYKLQPGSGRVLYIHGIRRKIERRQEDPDAQL